MRMLHVLFRFLLKIQGAVVLGAIILREENAAEIRIRRNGNAKPRCPKHPSIVLSGDYVQRRVRWRHYDLMKAKTYLVADLREGRCPKCDGRRIEAVPWAASRSRHTRAFDRRVASLVQVADKSAASRMFNVAWRTVGRMVRRVVKDLLPDDLLDNLTCIGVDETSYKRGHRYITIVTDLISDRVVWVGKGKNSKTLGRFFELLGPVRRSKIELVTMDMSKAYIKAVREYAKNADIVFDRFHVLKLLLDAVDEVRRDECRSNPQTDAAALKNTRFALLRNPRHLKPADVAAIDRVKSTNARLTRAYELRVDFENLWVTWKEDDARSFLMRWTRSALLSRREPLKKFARTVRTYIDGILGFIRWGGATNSRLEGIANKIKLCIHKAYGFGTVSALMAMVHLCCSGIVLE
jgi:transposase